MAADHDELKRVLAGLMADHEEAFERAQWPWETHRWYQLSYCVMASVEGRWQPDNNSAAALAALLELDLLEPGHLGKPDWSDQDLHLMELVLIRKGFNEQEAAGIINTLRSLAVYVAEKWDGYVQQYLRNLGNELIDRVTNELPLPDLTDQQASLAVTHWLQDVLGIPVLVDSPPLAELMKRTGARRPDVLSVLDELDVNAALADEILTTWSGMPQPDDDLSEGAA